MFVLLSKDLILCYFKIIIEYNFLFSKLTTQDSLVKSKNDVEQMASLDVHDDDDDDDHYDGDGEDY